MMKSKISVLLLALSFLIESSFGKTAFELSVPSKFTNGTITKANIASTTTKPNEKTIDEIEFIIQSNLKKLVSLAKAKVTPPYEKLVGIWDLDSSENFDELLQKIGISWIKRKLYVTLKPTVIISHDNNDQWTITTKSSVKTTEIKFYIGKPFEEETLDDRKVMTTFTFIGEKLIQTQRDPKTGKTICEVTREVNKDNHLVTKAVVDDVISTRIYHRKNK